MRYTGIGVGHNQVVEVNDLQSHETSDNPDNDGNSELIGSDGKMSAGTRDDDEDILDDTDDNSDFGPDDGEGDWIDIDDEC